MPDACCSATSRTPFAPLALEAAISLLEAGTARDDIAVDLGEGRVARADGALQQRGLLQRLRGHRLLLAMLEDVSGVPGPGDDGDMICPQVRELLDAVREAG